MCSLSLSGACDHWGDCSELHDRRRSCISATGLWRPIRITSLLQGQIWKSVILSTCIWAAAACLSRARSEGWRVVGESCWSATRCTTVKWSNWWQHAALLHNFCEAQGEQFFDAWLPGSETEQTFAQPPMKPLSGEANGDTASQMRDAICAHLARNYPLRSSQLRPWKADDCKVTVKQLPHSSAYCSICLVCVLCIKLHLMRHCLAHLFVVRVRVIMCVCACEGA